MRSDPLVLENAATSSFSGWFGSTYVVLRPGIFPRIGDVPLERELPGPVGVVTTPSQATLGRADALAEALGDARAGVYAAAADHTSAEQVVDASGALAGCRSVVALGGGAAIGLVKALAVAGHLPYAAYPTTFSGSEMTDIYGVVEAGEKVVRRDPAARASAVLYDPELFATLPPRVMRASLVNCVAHCIELAWIRDVPPAATLAAEEACRLIGAYAEAASAGEALDGLVTAASLAGVALSIAGVGVHHAICHVLGGAAGAPHALLHTVALPAVMLLNRDCGTHLQRRFVAHLCGDVDSAPHEAVAELRRRWGLPASLREVWPGDFDLDEIADRVLVSAPTSRNLVPIERGALHECLDRMINGL